MAVAPPKSKERQRFIVEKLQEMSVRRLVWIDTERSQVRPPRPDRSDSWAASALEQSRGAWLMEIGTAEYAELSNPFVADVAGMPLAAGGRWVGDVTIAVGPEGGFSETEITMFSNHVALGSGVLRTETAAISLAAVVMFGAS
jgi:16S rRNA (uracil1498-N3)-methyltransferase